MSDDTLVARLVDEVEDLLVVSHVGLFELRWILRGAEPALDDDSVARISSSALSELSTKGFGLAWFVWPEDEPRARETRSPSELGDVWLDPRQGERYLALLPR